MKRNILISWRGSQGTFAKCSSVLQKSFIETTVPWRKKGNQFPCHIILPVTFVPYTESFVVSTSKVTFKQRLNCALCHIYFTDCADTEEYRGKVRSDLVEWFASLRDAGCWDWLIVIDTVRARENKGRVQLLEKLKSDFAKYPTKIVEVESSSSKMPALTRSLRDQLVASLDSVVVGYEDYLQAEKEKCYSKDWNLLSYVDSQFSLSQLYSALGLQDQVLAQYDEIHALISVLIWNLAYKANSGQSPVWLRKLLEEEADRCPSLLLSATATSKASTSLSEGKMSLIELRVLLLARQLVALLDQYNVRLQSVTSVSIQTQYCALLLSYADNCLRSIFEEMDILQIKWCRLKRCCWVCLFAEEVFSLCSKLADPVRVDSAADCICHLWMEYCNSMCRLEKEIDVVSGSESVFESEDVLDLVSYLPDTPDIDGVDGKTEGLSPVSKIKHMLSSKSAFCQHYQKTFESSMAVLKHFNWKRHAEFQGKILADFLVKLPGNIEAALPHYVKLLNNLAKEKWERAYVKLLEETIRFFELSESYKTELLEFYATLAVKSCIPIDSRRKFAKKLLRVTESEDSHCTVLEKTVQRWVEVPEGLVVSPPQPNPYQKITCELCLTSNFPIPLPVKLQVCCKVTGRFFSGRPRFRVELHEDGARLTCSGSHSLLAPRSSDLMPQECSPGGFQADVVLNPGRNDVELFAEPEDVGSFLTDHLHVQINNFGLEMSIPEQLQILFHVRTELPSAKLTKTKDSDHLCGGFSQRLKLIVSPGSVATKQETSVLISAEDSNLIFRVKETDEWQEQIRVNLPPLASNTTHNYFLEGLLVLRGLRDQSVVSAKGKVEWLDAYLWPYELLFMPLLYTVPRLNVLEDRVLFQNTMCCCALSESQNTEEPAVLPLNVVLCNQENSSEVFEILNPQLEPLAWGEKYKFVWVLPSAGASRYVMKMKYKLAKDESGQEYTYVDPVAFDTSKAVYELCCQITSRGLLCRAESQCDLVISLRSLHPERRAESLTLGLEASATQWHLNEKQKVVQVKESGLGQVTFGVVPKSMGYLPLPSVIFLRNNQDSGTQSLPLKLYIRTEGKQVHVLAPLPRGKMSTQSMKDQ